MIGSVRMVTAAGLAAFSVAGPSGGQMRSPSASDAPADARGDPPLSVMTYNIKGLPWPLALGRGAALATIADRLAALRRQGRQPHIVLLQEAFVREAAGIAARAGYRYSVAGPRAGLRSRVAAEPGDIAYLNGAFWHRGEQVDKSLGSGLLILSDYPISASVRLAFPDFACAGFDCLANKGVLVAHLQVPGVGAVSVVNTHLNARRAAGVPVERSLRAFDRQAALLVGFVRANVPAGRPLVLGGDMNIGGDAARRRLFFGHFARARLGFVTASLCGVKGALAHAAIDTRARRDLALADERGKDWLFARGARSVPLRVASGRVPFGTEPKGEPLSDHYGYQIGYALPRPAAGTRAS